MFFGRENKTQGPEIGRQKVRPGPLERNAKHDKEVGDTFIYLKLKIATYENRIHNNLF